MDEQAGKQPTFSAADLERARATLRGRPEEAASLQRLDRGCPDRRLHQPGSHREGARGGKAPGLGDQLDPGSAAPRVAPACQAASHQDPHPGGVGDLPGAAGAGPAGADGGGEGLLRRGDARPGVVAGAGGAEGQGQIPAGFRGRKRERIRLLAAPRCGGRAGSSTRRQRRRSWS